MYVVVRYAEEKDRKKEKTGMKERKRDEMKKCDLGGKVKEKKRRKERVREKRNESHERSHKKERKKEKDTM